MPIKETFSSFPVFDIESQLSDSDTSSANDSVLSAKYATKEDQDVAVFMAIAERLSIKSLSHLFVFNRLGVIDKQLNITAVFW